MTPLHPNLRIVREVLGEPTFETPGGVLYNLDCLSAMHQLPASLVNLTVTSPPYNIGKEYEEKLPVDVYLKWCEEWIREVHKLTVPNGSFLLNVGYISLPTKAKAIPISYLLWQYVPFFLVQEIVWNYGAGVAGKKFYSPRNEKFLWYIKDEENYTFNLDDVRDPDVKYPNQKKNGKIKVNPLGKNPSDVWQFPKVTSGTNRSSIERTEHPAQFPEAVIERIIRASSNPGDLILDPFMGSGTTAAVALRLGRSVLGFEMNPRYCQLASCRIEQALKSPKTTIPQKQIKMQKISSSGQGSLLDWEEGE